MIPSAPRRAQDRRRRLWCTAVCGAACLAPVEYSSSLAAAATDMFGPPQFFTPALLSRTLLLLGLACACPSFFFQGFRQVKSSPPEESSISSVSRAQSPETHNGSASKKGPLLLPTYRALRNSGSRHRGAFIWIRPKSAAVGVLTQIPRPAPKVPSFRPTTRRPSFLRRTISV